MSLSELLIVIACDQLYEHILIVTVSVVYFFTFGFLDQLLRVHLIKLVSVSVCPSVHKKFPISTKFVVSIEVDE